MNVARSYAGFGKCQGLRPRCRLHLAGFESPQAERDKRQLGRSPYDPRECEAIGRFPIPRCAGFGHATLTRRGTHRGRAPRRRHLGAAPSPRRTTELCGCGIWRPVRPCVCLVAIRTSSSVRALSKSHTRNVRSLEAETTRLPSNVTATACTVLVWPRKVRSDRPVFKSHNRRVSSFDPNRLRRRVGHRARRPLAGGPQGGHHNPTSNSQNPQLCGESIDNSQN